jgi:hypothetical protein
MAMLGVPRVREETPMLGKRLGARRRRVFQQSHQVLETDNL